MTSLIVHSFYQNIKQSTAHTQHLYFSRIQFITCRGVYLLQLTLATYLHKDTPAPTVTEYTVSTISIFCAAHSLSEHKVLHISGAEGAHEFDFDVLRTLFLYGS